jgi:peptidoglycan/LPS O-acetylase OafA/YrhL
LQSIEDPAPQVAHALFFALQRNSWGLAIAWIVFSCEMGGGGIVKKFFELPLWIPLGRMSLSFYLVHGLYFTIHAGSGRVPVWFSDAQLVI